MATLRSSRPFEEGMRVLIIESNADLASNLFDFLEAKRHVPDVARDGITGLHLALVNQYDAIVLDLKLPRMDGITLCRKLRKECGRNTPILIIAESNALEDKIAVLEAGGDDYLIKPAELHEVEVRLRVLHRRGNGYSFPKDKRIVVGDLILDPSTRLVQRGEKTIRLSRIPFKILEALMARSPQVVTRNALEQIVWGDNHPVSDSLRNHMYFLREHIDKPFQQRMLRTLPGFGYQLTSPKVQEQY
jgi:DNA-binding response OmpR family regulator